MRITSTIRIEDDDICFEYIRSCGPGGQNVNKVATAVRLRVSVDAIVGLDGDGRTRLAALAGKRLTAEGELVLRSDTHRTREANRRAALERLADLVSKAAVRPKSRKATRPGRGAVERRLAAKARRASLKAQRRGTED
jgi:ribosome-associated protein